MKREMFLTALVALSILGFGAQAYPVPSGDSQAFLPPAISLEAGGGLRNPLSDLTRRIDPSGEARFIQYPPLFQRVLSALMRNPTARDALLALGILNAANLALTALLFARVTAAAGPGGSAGPATGIAILGIATTFAGHQSGRPETLATLWVLLGAHALLRADPRKAWLASGVLLGLLGATHPVGGALGGLLLCLYTASRLAPRQALAALSKAATLALAVFLATLGSGPFGIIETLEGIARHGYLVLASRRSEASLVTYWVTHPGASFYALPYLLLAWQILATRPWRSAMVRSRWIFLPGLSALLASAWLASLRRPELSYNLLLFAPLVFAGNLWLAHPQHASGATALVGRAVSLGHLLAAVGYLRSFVLFWFFLAQGTGLEEARRDFTRLAPEPRERVAVTSSLWTLSERYDRMSLYLPGAPEGEVGADLVLVQQIYSGRLTPPEIEGFVRVADRFVRHPPRLFGVKVANTVPGYAFAAYRRRVPPSAVASRPDLLACRNPDPGALFCTGLPARLH